MIEAVAIADPQHGRKWLAGFLAKKFVPRVKMTLREWAEKHFVITKKGNRYPGRFKFANNPVMLGPVLAFDSGLYRRILMICAAQTFKSTILQLVFGYVIDQDPGPGMFLFPDSNTLKRRSNEHLQPLIAECPAVNRHTTGRVTDIQTMAFSFDTCNWAMAFAGSANTMRADSRRWLIRDEISAIKHRDKLDSDPMSLSESRTNQFDWLAMILDATTPLDVNAPGWADLLKSTFHRCWLPCPNCSDLSTVADVPQFVSGRGENVEQLEARLSDAGFQVITFSRDQWKFDSKATGELVEKNCRVLCQHCQEEITDVQRKRFCLPNHKWIPQNPDSDCFGCQAPAWLAPWRSWGKIARKFVEATQSGDTQKLKETKTQDWAEAWEDKEIAIQSDFILAHKPIHVPYRRDYIPFRPVFVGMTADVQQDELYYRVRAVTEGGTTAGIRYGMLPRHKVTGRDGKLPDGTSLRALIPIINMEFPCMIDGLVYPIDACWIDSNYDRQEVYAFCRSQPDHVQPYSASPTLKQLWHATRPETDPIRKEPLPDSVQLYTLNADDWKDRFTRLDVALDDSGAWWLEAEAEEIYADMFTRDVKISVVNNRGQTSYRWDQKSGDNHYFDNEYVLAAQAFIYGCDDMSLQPMAASSTPAPFDSDRPRGDFVNQGKPWKKR